MNDDRPSVFAQMGMAAVEAQRAGLVNTVEALTNARVAYLQGKPELTIERLTWALFTAQLERRAHRNAAKYVGAVVSAGSEAVN